MIVYFWYSVFWYTVYFGTVYTVYFGTVYTVIIGTIVDLDLWLHMASLGLSELHRPSLTCATYRDKLTYWSYSQSKGSYTQGLLLWYVFYPPRFEQTIKFQFDCQRIRVGVSRYYVVYILTTMTKWSHLQRENWSNLSYTKGDIDKIQKYFSQYLILSFFYKSYQECTHGVLHKAP